MTSLIIYHIKRDPQAFIMANLMVWGFAALATM